MNDFLSVDSVPNVEALVAEALKLKSGGDGFRSVGQGKTLGMLFMNPSTRTRISTWKAARLLGMDVITLNMTSDTWKIETEDGAVMDMDKPEHIKDAAGVLGQYCDIIGLRSFALLKDKAQDESETILNAFVKYSGRPIVSLESSLLHPLQSLSDVMTIKEHAPVGRSIKVVLSWAPHVKPIPQAVANSFAQWVQHLPGTDLHICHPEGYSLDTQFTGQATLHSNQADAFKDADFIYFKNWSSFDNYGEMPAVKGDWLPGLNELSTTNDAKVMHCLPVRRNLEVKDELLDFKGSLVQAQAGNRVYAAMAVLKNILEQTV